MGFRKISVYLMFAILIIAGCNKEPVRDKVIPPTGDYFPLTANSYWHYIPANNTTGLNFTARILDIHPNIMGNTYQVLNYNAGNPRVGNFWDSSLFRKENGKYYQALYPNQLPYPLTQTTTELLEFEIMEDNAPVGTKWTNTITGTFTFSNGSVRTETTIVTTIFEYYSTFKLDDTHTFNDVVKVTIDTKSKFYGTNSEYLGSGSDFYENWYARGMGLIQMIQPLYPHALKVSDFKVF